MLLVYHIYIALSSFQAGLLALRAEFPQIFKIYVENLRYMVLE